MKGDLLGTAIIFFVVFFIVWFLAAGVFKSNEIGFLIGLVTGLFVSGTGKFILEHKTGG